MSDEPRHVAERFRGHALTPADLLVTRPPSSRRIYVGLRGSGYVRLRPRQARDLAFALLELAGTED